MILTLLSVIIFTGHPFPPLPPFTGARGARKWHQGFNYSYHRVQNSYQLFQKSGFDTNVGLLIFLDVTPFQPLPILLLRGTFKWHWKCHYPSQRPEKL